MTLTELKKIAKAATPGPWEVMGTEIYTSNRDIEFATGGRRLKNKHGIEYTRDLSNANFIVTFNPSRVLKLIEQLQIAIGALENYSSEKICAQTIDSLNLFVLREHKARALGNCAREALSRIEELEENNL